jgi:hypothetical protein
MKTRQRPPLRRNPGPKRGLQHRGFDDSRGRQGVALFKEDRVFEAPPTAVARSLHRSGRLLQRWASAVGREAHQGRCRANARRKRDPPRGNPSTALGYGCARRLG